MSEGTMDQRRALEALDRAKRNILLEAENMAERFSFDPNNPKKRIQLSKEDKIISHLLDLSAITVVQNYLATHKKEFNDFIDKQKEREYEC